MITYRTPTIGLIIAALSAGFAWNCHATPDASSIKDRYFTQDWAAPDAAQPPSTPAIKNLADDGSDDPDPADDPNYPGADSGNSDGTQDPVESYAKIPHRTITYYAYRMYASQFEHSELDQFIGDSPDETVPAKDERTVMSGSYQEDEPWKNPWFDTIPELQHFWDCQKGPKDGIFTNTSTVDRATKYWTGGYGLSGSLDPRWSSKTIGQGTEELYKNGDKAQAYWYLGHMSHLLEDMTVPAHTLLWPHPIPGQDAYEHYMSKNFQNYLTIPSSDIESFDTLYDIYFQTCNITNGFDAGFRGGLAGKDGRIDQGKRRGDGFSQQDLTEEGNVLIPLAIKRVAALFLYFYKQLDHTPPHVELIPTPAPGSKIILHASATDDASGVNRKGYRFEYAAWTGNAWSPWSSVTPRSTGSSAVLAAKPQTRYELRVWATDAAGNRGVSAVKYIDTSADLLVLGASQ